MKADFVHKHVEEIASTNEFLWNLSEEEKLADFYTITAGFQTKGKGQDTNSWESEKDQNILSSTLVYPQFLFAENAFQISRWISISIVNYLEQKGVKDLKIKWPNDIYLDEKKIAGILIQNAMKGNFISKSMFGIGLNVNQLEFHSNAPNPISLKQVLDKKYSIAEEVFLMIDEIKKAYKVLEHEPQKIIKDYHHLLYQREEWHHYKVGERTIRGKIKGVNQFGQLLLQNKAGKNVTYDIKELKFIPTL